jgi:hypothetical protein
MAKKVEENKTEDQVSGTIPAENPAVDRNVDQSGEAVVNTTGKRPGEVLVSGAEFLEFKNVGEVFTGYYTGRQSIRQKDGKEENQKAGDVMGYYFVTSDGTEVIIGNSFNVKTAMEKGVKEGDVLYIEFLGQEDLGGGKKVNKLHIARLTADEKKRYGF